MINTFLLLVLDLFAVFYVVQALLPETKKSFFKRELNRVNRQIWDAEFKVEKTLQIKEGIRQDRDKLNDAKFQIEAKLKDTPDDKELLKQFGDLVDTIKRYELQMNMLDKQISGVRAEGDNPGEEGINDTISSLAELRAMYKDYLTKI